MDKLFGADKIDGAIGYPLDAANPAEPTAEGADGQTALEGR